MIHITLFHPDYTVGFGISPNQLSLADSYRRSGISPCPESIFKTSESINDEIKKYNSVTYKIQAQDKLSNIVGIHRRPLAQKGQSPLSDTSV